MIIFQFIFDLILNSFFENEIENEIENELKMAQKWQPWMTLIYTSEISSSKLSLPILFHAALQRSLDSSTAITRVIYI